MRDLGVLVRAQRAGPSYSGALGNAVCNEAACLPEPLAKQGSLRGKGQCISALTTLPGLRFLAVSARKGF